MNNNVNNNPLDEYLLSVLRSDPVTAEVMDAAERESKR
jgi:hypothetical protein